MMRDLAMVCLAMLAVAPENGGSLAGLGQGCGDAGSDPAVAQVKSKVQPEIDKHLADRQAEVMDRLASSKRIPAKMKLPVRVVAMSDPWGAMMELERSGLGLASAAREGVRGVGPLLDRMSQAIGKPEGTSHDVGPPKGTGLEDQVEYALAILDSAKRLRDAALPKMTSRDRKAMFAWSATLSKNFSGQVGVSDRSRQILQNDGVFCEAVHKDFDWGKLLAAAQCLAQLADRPYLDRLGEALSSAERTSPASTCTRRRDAAKRVPDSTEVASPSILEETPSVAQNVDGVTGDLLYATQTPHGWILFGGRGNNTYKLTAPVALIVDLGGDDTYQGTVAASFDHDHPNQVVVDLAGDDRYQGDPHKLACGRLGVGMLFDLAGKDHYELAQGSGGTGFGGIGVLCDAAGDDTYTGSRHTQGAAIAGIGLLLDLKGNDQYTSFGYAVGFAGPAAAGALIDVEGDDSYQCGHKYPSAYNKSGVKPGDPSHQYTAFGMGTGLGRRAFSAEKKGRFYAPEFCLAGGLGIVLDLAGDDSYDTSNFSQACGYFFGVGLKMDLAGNDRHQAARYGCSSGAHYGMGLFLDYEGKDTYQSTGPTYNGACAWDYSVFLAVEAAGDDTYQLQKSRGPARADISSWSVFAEMGGDDDYQLREGPGITTRNSLSAFFDHAGCDTYQVTEKTDDFTPADHTTRSQDPGGLFVDQ